MVTELIVEVCSVAGEVVKEDVGKCGLERVVLCRNDYERSGGRGYKMSCMFRGGLAGIGTWKYVLRFRRENRRLWLWSSTNGNSRTEENLRKELVDRGILHPDTRWY